MLPKEPIMFACRSDGLGQRLWAILNAIVLRNKIGGTFNFYWPTDDIGGLHDHAIAASNLVFSNEFLEKNHCDVPSDILSIGKDADFSGLTGALRIEPANLSERLPSISIDWKDFRDAFEEIEFSQSMQLAIAAARDFDISNNTVAAHIRAGDIVYGKYRFDDRFTSKIVPYPVLNYALSQSKKEGRDILIFGQDLDVCTYLSEAHGAAIPFYSKEKYLQAIFEIVLMSRCHTIFCGSSGFAQLASLIGGSSQINPSLSMTTESQLDCFDKSLNAKLDQMPDLQKSFSNWYAFRSCRSILTYQKQDIFLSEACRLDPTNDFYKVALASVLFQNGHFDRAEAILSKTSGKNVDGGLWRVLRPKPSGHSVALRFISSYLGAANHGCYMANLCLGLKYFFEDNLNEAQRFLNKCATIDPKRKNANAERLTEGLIAQRSK